MVETLVSEEELSEKLKKEAKNLGFSAIGIASIPGSTRIKLRTDALHRWLKAGYQADMHWMEAQRRENIETLLQGVKSVLAVGLNYYVDLDRKPESLLIARYAWGKDYHKTISKKLKKLGQWLEKERPNCQWRACVDSTPLLDKVWAEEAGLGWIGKNSNVINKKLGSWMVLGHLLCTEKLKADKPSTASCGECDICITSCPTQAISEPFVINSNKCLAYHTIENKSKVLPNEISNAMGKWIVGCDICQEVCPWNKNNIPSNNDPEVQPQPWILNLTKKDVLSWTDELWKEKLRGSALKRIKPFMWRRNANAIKQNKKK